MNTKNFLRQILIAQALCLTSVVVTSQAGLASNNDAYQEHLKRKQNMYLRMASSPVIPPKNVVEKKAPKKTTVLRKKKNSETKKGKKLFVTKRRKNTDKPKEVKKLSVPQGRENTENGADSDRDSKRITPRTKRSLDALVNIHGSLEKIITLQELIEVK